MQNPLNKLYHNSLTLLTDLYQFTMAYGYWKNNLHEQDAVFNLIFRRLPFNGGYTVCAGLETVIDYLDNWQFQSDDLAYLSTLQDTDGKPLFEKQFLDYLSNLKLSCDVDAIEEGNIVFPQEPLIRIKGSLLQCQLLETTLLNIINFQSLIATKASRVCHASKGDPIIEFGLRRAQGFDGGISVSRAAYIGGCVGTSNVLAGKLYNIPVMGTHAHSWIMSFPNEYEAFQAYAHALPGHGIFLVDTYNTLAGVKNAIEIGKQLQQQGYKLLGVRLDSGDLAYLSIKARQLLDKASFTDTAIIASGELDEYVIASLKEQGAKINIWGVGTRLATAYDQPALDGVYKITAIRNANSGWQPKIKLSEQTAKITTPGLLRARRFYDKKGLALADAIYDERLGIGDECNIIDPLDPLKHRKVASDLQYSELLKPIYRSGKRVYEALPLNKIRENTQANLNQFHESTRRFLNPHVYPVGLEEKLYNMKLDLIEKMRNK